MLGKIATSAVIASVLTALSYGVALFYNWPLQITWMEVFAVWTSYSCTYLCVVQSRWNYPIGAISVAAYTLVFWQAGLYASAGLNAYLFPTLVYGFWRWGPDRDTRPVRHVERQWIPVYLGLTGLTAAAVAWICYRLGGSLPLPDATILVLSILAQFLLDQKKMETWAVWAVVNVLAIYTYWYAGLLFASLQYFVFLLNVFFGYVAWRSTCQPRTA